MELKIEHHLLEGLDLKYILPTAFKSGKMVLNNEEIKGKRGKFIIQNKGEEVEVKIRANIIDTIPKVEVNGEKVLLAEPLKWYQYVWMCLPILMVINGGFIGIFIGMITARINISTFRSDKSTFYKYVFTGFYSLLAVALYISIAWQLLQL